MTRWTELREAAEKATPGPWAQGMVGDRLIAEVDYSAAFGFVKVTEQSDDGANGVADANFIAAANPSVVLDALAERDELEKLCEEQHHALRQYDAMQCWTPESRAEAIADGEECWCGGCSTARALAHYDQMTGEEA